MRFVAGVVLAVVACGCYGPSFNDCTVRCTDTCPSGLECGVGGRCHRPWELTRACGAEWDAKLPDAPIDSVDSSIPPADLDISVGGGHACAISGIDLACWGRNVSSQLGVVTAGSRTGDPQDVPGTYVA